MNVDLDDLIVVHQNQTVAQLLEEGPQLLRVPACFPGDDEFGAVGEGDVLCVKFREIGLLLGRFHGSAFGDGHILSPQGQEHGLQGPQPALAAGVDDPGFFQHRVLIDRIGQGHPGLLYGGLVDKFKVTVFLGSLACLGGRQAGNGEDGAFRGFHDRLVSGVHALLKGLGPQDAVAL